MQKLTHLRRIEFPTIINLTSPFPFYGCWVCFLSFSLKFDKTFSISVSEHQTDSVTSDLGLHYLPMSHWAIKKGH